MIQACETFAEVTENDRCGQSCWIILRLSKADGLFSRKPLIIRQVLKSAQSMQVGISFSFAHLRISQRCSQNVALVPFSRQPSQLMCSGRIGVLFRFAHSAAVFSLKA